MSDPDNLGTLTDIVRLFTDEAYQKYMVSKVTNPIVKDWWTNTFNAMGSREKQEMIPYFASKFGAFITNATMRNIIGQAKSGFDFKDIMDNKRILIVNLSKGQIGELNANLLGMIIVTKLQVAAMKRAEVPENERVPFYLYIDEFQNVVTDAIETILSEARKYKFSLNIAHQYIGQLDKFEGIKNAVFGNVGTKMCYTISAEDAEFMAKEFSPTFSEQDLVNLDARTGVVKLSIDIQASRPFSIKGDPPREGDKNIANAIKQLSRLKYARDVKFVEREINARLGTT
jgi:type IV secretory pathway TraG/TraD family ATPase VirD4